MTTVTGPVANWEGPMRGNAGALTIRGHDKRKEKFVRFRALYPAGRCSRGSHIVQMQETFNCMIMTIKDEGLAFKRTVCIESKALA